MWYIQSIRIQVKEVLSPRHIRYREIQGQGVIPLTCTDEKFLLHENGTKSCRIGLFLERSNWSILSTILFLKLIE
jgi:hypothetical protein